MMYHTDDITFQYQLDMMILTLAFRFSIGKIAFLYVIFSS